MGQSCLASCVCVSFFPQRLPNSQPREALPIPLAGTVPVAVSAGTWWPARSNQFCRFSFQHSPTRGSCWLPFSSSCSWSLRSSVPPCSQQCCQTDSQHLFCLMLKKVPTGRWLKCLRSNMWPPCHLWVSSCTEGVTLGPFVRFWVLQGVDGAECCLSCSWRMCQSWVMFRFVFSECSRLWSQIQAKLPGSPSLTKPRLLAALPGIGQREDSGFSLPTGRALPAEWSWCLQSEQP